MSGRMLLAALITALGAAITLVNLRDGLTFSFPLLLGVLLLADGLLRFSMLTADERGPVERQEDERAVPATAAADRPLPLARATPDGVASRPTLPSWEPATEADESPVVAAREPTVLHPPDVEGAPHPATDLRTDRGDAARSQPD
jgi:hypothetical protein